jgi:hypothetical protein
MTALNVSLMVFCTVCQPFVSKYGLLLRISHQSSVILILVFSVLFTSDLLCITDPHLFIFVAYILQSVSQSLCLIFIPEYVFGLRWFPYFVLRKKFRRDSGDERTVVF